MDRFEMSNLFDVLFNNITSNQAPGLNEFEKSIFLTKAQDEKVKNNFLPQGNTKQAGYDDNPKRQMDFSKLMRVAELSEVKREKDGETLYPALDPRSTLYEFPLDTFLIINEAVIIKDAEGNAVGIRQVIPLSYDEYMVQMSKPYKNPNKDQAWRLITTSTKEKEANATEQSPYYGNSGIAVELILTNTDRKLVKRENSPYSYVYSVRYVKRPKPIILTDLTDLGNDLSINGYNGSEEFYLNGRCCELDESMHEEIVQRAVELAKIAWQGDAQAIMQAGQRSE